MAQSYSEAGLALTRSFEGVRLRAYPDAAGVWTIGYGHTGADVHEGLEISLARAEQLLETDLRCAVRYVCDAVTIELTQAQFDALVDFCFNEGCGALRGSMLLRLVNERRFDEAAAQFARWDVIDGKPNAGLMRRRAAEAALFAK